MLKFILSDKFIIPVVNIIVGIIIYYVIKIIVKRIFKYKGIDKKKATIISLVKNILKYVIIILTVLSILSVYGVDTSGIIASIGIIGVVIGLALQDIVADFLGGIAIIFDNKYAIGDIVMIDDFKGEVISLGLMTTRIKAATGDVKIISNSSFKNIINYSVNNAIVLINLDVSYDTDIDLLEKVLKEMGKEVLDINGVIDNYKLLGINEFASSSIKYLVSIEAKYDLQYQVKRDYLKIVKKYFNKYKIEIPYNKMDIYMKGDKDE